MNDYVIKAGDSLSKIANANNTTVSNLAQANNIQDVNKISAGATLKIPSIIPVANLSTPTTNINVATPQVDTNALTTVASQAQGYTTGALQDAEAQAKAFEASKQQANDAGYSDLAVLQSQLGGQGLDRANQYNTQDATGTSVNTLAGRIRTLAAQGQNLATQNTLIPVQIQQNAANTGATDRGVAADQAGQLRNNLIQQATIAQQVAIAKADYDTAKSYADQIVDAKYDQLTADIEAKKTNLANIRDTLTTAQKKTADATTARLNKQQADYEEQKANEKALSDVLIKASQQDAPQNLVAKARLAKTAEEAASILGSYAGDYWGIKAKVAEYNKTLAETAKINSDARVNREKATAGSPAVTVKVNADGTVTKVSPAQSWIDQWNAGTMELKDIYTQIPANDSALQNEVARLVAAQGGKRIVPMDDAQISAIDDQIKNIDDLVNGDVGSIVGFVRGGLGIVPDSMNVYKQSALAIAENLVSNQTLQSLTDAKAKGITFGALSEAELNAVASAASRISAKTIRDKETGKIVNFTGSEGDFINDLKLIKDKLEKSKLTKTGQATGVSALVEQADAILSKPDVNLGGYQFTE